MKVWSWRQCIEESELKPSTKLVLYTLANYMNEYGEGCYPSVSRLCKGTGLKERALYSHLSLAEEAGFIRREKRNLAGSKWSANEYKACMPSGVHVDAGHDDGVHEDAGLGCTRMQVMGCTQVHTNSPVTNTPKNTPIKNNKKVSYEDEFREFWRIYPLKRKRKDAVKKFEKARQDGISLEEIISGLNKYKAWAEENSSWYTVQEAPAWLNGERWQDEYTTAEKNVLSLFEGGSHE